MEEARSGQGNSHIEQVVLSKRKRWRQSCPRSLGGRRVARHGAASQASEGQQPLQEESSHEVPVPSGAEMLARPRVYSQS